MESFLSIIAMVLVLDFYLYGIHRALHHFPWLWAIHRHHHADYKAVFHVGEFALLWLVPMLTAWLTGLMGAMFVVAFSFIFEVGVTHTPGYRATSKLHRWVFLKTRKFLSNAAYHKRHHDNPGVNYAQLFTVWDRICGTQRGMR